MNQRSKQGVKSTKAPSSDEEARAELARLVQASRDGDDEAFAELFRRFRDKVYRIAHRFTRDHDEAMDLTQTVFIKVHRSLDSYRAESAFATWISRITTNACIDASRARKRAAEVRLEDTREVTSQALPSAGLAGPRPGPAAQLANAELGEAIRAAVDDLSDKHRPVFCLHCVDGMAYKEIASTLGISIGTVMSRLYHARRYLRKSLAPYLGEARVRTLLGETDAAPAGSSEEAS